MKRLELVRTKRLSGSCCLLWFGSLLPVMLYCQVYLGRPGDSWAYRTNTLLGKGHLLWLDHLFWFHRPSPLSLSGEENLCLEGLAYWLGRFLQLGLFCRYSKISWLKRRSSVLPLATYFWVPVDLPFLAVLGSFEVFRRILIQSDRGINFPSCLLLLVSNERREVLNFWTEGITSCPDTVVFLQSWGCTPDCLLATVKNFLLVWGAWVA